MDQRVAWSENIELLEVPLYVLLITDTYQKDLFYNVLYKLLKFTLNINKYSKINYNM
jgi:hypothetical protein